VPLPFAAAAFANPAVASALIGGATKIIGGILGNSAAKKRAKAEEKRFQEQLKYDRDRDASDDAFSKSIFDMVPELQKRSFAQEDYYKEFNANNRSAAQELQDYLRGIDAQNYGNAQDDSTYARSAQSLRDDAAAESRRYDLQRIADNTRISGEERRYALDQMDRERDIAASERQVENEDIARTQAVKADEYRDRYARLTQDRVARASERGYEQNKQDLVISQASKMRDNVQRVLAEQGNLRAPELLGPGEIANEAARRGANYTDIIDKLSDRQMSQLEAQLMRRGMQTGADSGDLRSEQIARLAPEYQKALLTAENEAAGVVEGKNKTLTDRFNALRQAREIALNEAQLREGAGMDMIGRLGELNSGILDRELGSASDYVRRATTEQDVRGPMDVNSGIYDRLEASGGTSQFNNLPTRSIDGTRASRAYDLQALPDYNWEGLLGVAASSRGGKNTTGATAALNERSKAAGDAAGRSSERLGRGIDSLASKGLDWLSSQPAAYKPGTWAAKGLDWSKDTRPYGPI